MGNKFDLKTEWLRAGLTNQTYVSEIGGGIVPEGKTRFLTYLRVERDKEIGVGDAVVSGIEIAIVSHTSCSSNAEGYNSMVSETFAKITLRITSISTAGTALRAVGDLLHAEVEGSIDRPILSVAGGNYMLLGVASCPTATVFAQYYDE